MSFLKNQNSKDKDNDKDKNAIPRQFEGSSKAIRSLNLQKSHESKKSVFDMQF